MTVKMMAAAMKLHNDQEDTWFFPFNFLGLEHKI